MKRLLTVGVLACLVTYGFPFLSWIALLDDPATELASGRAGETA